MYVLITMNLQQDVFNKIVSNQREKYSLKIFHLIIGVNKSKIESVKKNHVITNKTRVFQNIFEK